MNDQYPASQQKHVHTVCVRPQPKSSIALLQQTKLNIRQSVPGSSVASTDRINIYACSKAGRKDPSPSNALLSLVLTVMERPVATLAITAVSTTGLASQKLVGLLNAHETSLSIAGVVDVGVILQHKLAISLFDVIV